MRRFNDSHRRCLVIGGSLALLAGCGADDGPVPGGGGWAGGSSHTGAGGQEVRCPPGERPVGDLECEPAGQQAGVPPELCGDGFVPSEPPGGCEAVLPATPCEAGLIALPGDDDCHELSPCGDGPWGSIETDASTVYVDAAYAGTDSDGSEAHPWTTIAEAVASQAAGGLIAIGAGLYVEDVRIETPGIRLWGRCPGLVRLRGVGVQPATLTVFGAPDVELRGLSVDGPRMGIWLRDASGVRLREVHAADTGQVGVALRGELTTATIETLLVESATAAGLLVGGASVEASGVAIRATRALSVGGQGYGVVVQPDPEEQSRGILVLAGAVVEQNRTAGVGVLGSDVVVERSVVRETRLDEESQSNGDGIQIMADPQTGERGSLQMVDSVVADNRNVGLIVIASDADVDRSVIRDTGWQSPGPGRYWGAAWVEDETTLEVSRGSLRRSLVERAADAAIVVSGAEVEVEGTVVRDTQLGPAGWARGIEITASMVGPQRTSAVVRASLVRGSRSNGVFVAGARADIDATAVRATTPGQSGSLGYGIVVQDHPDTLERGTGTIRFSAVEDNTNCGILVSSSDVTIESTAVRRTSIGPSGETGYGVQVQSSGHGSDLAGGVGRLVVRDSLVEDSGEAAVAVYGSDAELSSCELLRSAGSPQGWFGDGLVLSPLRGISATVTASELRIAQMHRAGIANFGGNLTVEGCTVDCNPIAINAETWLGFAPVLVDGGGNWCGCDAVEQGCSVLSGGLEPPDPLE